MSCIARQIIHHWSIREVPELQLLLFAPGEVCLLSISFSVIFCSAIMRSYKLHGLVGTTILKENRVKKPQDAFLQMTEVLPYVSRVLLTSQSSFKKLIFLSLK